jgi:uncharacterized repeat protein (TIGR01451 family)
MLAGGALGGCGSAPAIAGLKVQTQVVALGGNAASNQVAQGSSTDAQITITNVGTSSLQGVTLRVAVPNGFTYTNTVSVTENGDSVRSADISPVSRQATLTWGSWTIGAGAPGLPSQVIVTAQFEATGGSGSTTLVPQVYATGYSGTLTAAPLALQVTPAPDLALSLRASPSTVTAGSTLTYVATLTNTGSGAAMGTTLSITLPSDFDYQSTVSTSGNASTGGATYPVVGSVIPNWIGFDIPGSSAGGPGVLTITFQVRVLPDVGAGVYQASATVVTGTGSSNENEIQTNYSALTPVAVTGP